MGSGTAYMEAMVSCWQKLKELPPPELLRSQPSRLH